MTDSQENEIKKGDLIAYRLGTRFQVGIVIRFNEIMQIEPKALIKINRESLGTLYGNYYDAFLEHTKPPNIRKDNT